MISVSDHQSKGSEKQICYHGVRPCYIVDNQCINGISFLFFFVTISIVTISVVLYMAFFLCYIGDNQCCNINDVSYFDVLMKYSRLIKKNTKKRGY